MSTTTQAPKRLTRRQRLTRRLSAADELMPAVDEVYEAIDCNRVEAKHLNALLRAVLVRERDRKAAPHLVEVADGE